MGMHACGYEFVHAHTHAPAPISLARLATLQQPRCRRSRTLLIANIHGRMTLSEISLRQYMDEENANESYTYPFSRPLEAASLPQRCSGNASSRLGSECLQELPLRSEHNDTGFSARLSAFDRRRIRCFFCSPVSTARAGSF